MSINPRTLKAAIGMWVQSQYGQARFQHPSPGLESVLLTVLFNAYAVYMLTSRSLHAKEHSGFFVLHSHMVLEPHIEETQNV